MRHASCMGVGRCTCAVLAWEGPFDLQQGGCKAPQVHKLRLNGPYVRFTEVLHVEVVVVCNHALQRVTRGGEGAELVDARVLHGRGE